MSSNRRAIDDGDDDDDGVFDQHDEEDEAERRSQKKSGRTKSGEPPVKKRKKLERSFIDDAAEESGEENQDDDDEEDEDDDNNDYVKDGFVVDEGEDDDPLLPKKKKDDLEDSDQDEDDEEDDDEGGKDRRRAEISRNRKLKKMRQVDRLLDEDLELIQEAKQELEEIVRGRDVPEPVVERSRVVARTEAELRQGLFDADNEEEQLRQKERRDAAAAPAAARKPTRVERYDEDGMDDFIEDDIGDQRDILDGGKAGLYDDENREVSEAQLNEASEIFGTDYLDFMAEDKGDEEEEELLGGRYRERGVGVTLGVDSDEDIGSEDDDDDDLFGDDDDDEVGGATPEQKAEALRLRRAKRTLAKEERRREAQLKKAERRKAKLRRAFEPIQLVENFCTERDDQIRLTDAPERFFDWTTPFNGSDQEGMSKAEEAEARWIVSRIRDIGVEFTDAKGDFIKQQSILLSIVYCLRFLHQDKLEPAFIKRYRKDYVTSRTVRENIAAIMDEDSEWDRLLIAKEKVGSLLSSISASARSDESVGADSEKLGMLQKELQAAQEKLDDTAGKESSLKSEIEALGDAEDDDDELFGDDDEEKAKERLRLQSHLSTVQSLLETLAEKVSQLQRQVQVVEAQNQALNDPEPAKRVSAKICRECLWIEEDYLEHLKTQNDKRCILDFNGYLNLIKEGNDAIRMKEMPLLSLGGTSKDEKDRKRSRRFDRDFYRTCVAEGLRQVCYKFLLSPYRTGIKLEDTVQTGKFDFTKVLPGEAIPEPLLWEPPVIGAKNPTDFANALVGSGELAQLSGIRADGTGSDGFRLSDGDGLRGCRYVAAMELASEPRIRKCLRPIYRRSAVLTTKPTSKGLDEIDAFHDFYGLHLIRMKPFKDHLPCNEKENEHRKIGLNEAERNELDSEMKRRETESCLQYLGVMKAEQAGFVTVHVHLPLLEFRDDWYRMENDQLMSRESQDISTILQELKKVYLPLGSDDKDVWNEERIKVLRLAIIQFLMPHFESEIRKDLREAAAAVGAQAAAESLRKAAFEGPYRPAAILHTENRFISPTGDLPVVGVCCASDAKEATYMAAVAEKGEFSDFLAIPGGTRADTGKMREKVVMFLLQYRPAAVLVGTSGGFESRIFQRKMVELIAEAVQRWSNRDIQGDEEDDDAFEARRDALRQLRGTGHLDYDDEDWKCNVDLIDDSVAQLFGRSVRGKKEFPELDVNLKCAISIARYAKDPLGEYTYAWSVASDAGLFGAELLYLNIHPMQQLVPRTLLLRQYERVLCECVADVGVDVNAACTSDHLRGLLTFVPGLGPRKAAFLKQTLLQVGGIARRRDIIDKRIFGPVVYNNAAAFLRIHEADHMGDQGVHPLDETRLHPDVYLRNNWAIKIAFDALEREDKKSSETASLKALRDVMEDSGKEVKRLYEATKKEWEKQYGPTFNSKDWDPRINVPIDQWRDKVEELDLDTFANMIERSGHGRWQSHLEMIKWEFRLPYVDPRKPLEPITGDKLFRLITGETDQTLRPGKEVTGKIVTNGDFGSRVKLEGDVPAFIPLRNISDEHVETADDFVAAGQVITAVVTEVKKDHMTVDLSLRMDDFRKRPSSWDRPQSLPPLDDHFDLNAAARIEEENQKKREARIELFQLRIGSKGEDDAADGTGTRRRRGRVMRRACTHPAFRNAKSDEVERELREGGAAMVGEALIRPSNRSSDSLAIHWVVREGIIKVVEVLEDEKENEASIGNKLKIKDESYGSIDELLGRYIAPMNDFVEEMVNHRKFCDLPEDEVDEKLKVEKTSNPKSIPYAVCWNDAHPGYASLRFISTSTVRSHPIGINPKGFSWGAVSYPSLDLLINAFKKNPRGITVKPKESKPIVSSTSSQPVSDAANDASSKGRWGAKALVTLPPPAPTAGWDRPPPPPLPVTQPVNATASWTTHQGIEPSNGWDAVPSLPPPPVSRPQPPPMPPPYIQPPPPRPPPPPTPILPPPVPVLPPPPPPTFAQPPPFDLSASAANAGQGRGRGRTLPAWMARGTS